MMPGHKRAQTIHGNNVEAIGGSKTSGTDPYYIKNYQCLHKTSLRALSLTYEGLLLYFPSDMHTQKQYPHMIPTNKTHN